MDKVDVKFGDWIQQGFDLFKNNLTVLIPATLISFILVIITGGILLGPMAAGLSLITLRLLDKTEPKPDVGDIFKGFDVFLQTFIYFLILSVISYLLQALLFVSSCLGPFLALFASAVLHSLLMFAVFLMAEKKMDFWSAAMGSFSKVKTNFWPYLGLVIIAAIAGLVGIFACGVGVFVTAPITYCILAVAYRASFNPSQEAAPAASAPEAPPAQPQQ